jgi:hypothetical protein
MSKTYRQPHCREDWQDISKLRFKDSNDKIVAVFIDDDNSTVFYNSPVILIIKAIEGYHKVFFYHFDGLAEKPLDMYTVVIEELSHE